MIAPELLPYVSNERLAKEFNLDNNPSMWHVITELAKRGRADMWRVDSEKVYALFAAGWFLEWPHPNLDPMSWSWRRPPKGTRETGRLFRSTGQAFSALQKEEA